MMYKPKHFSIKELVDEQLYNTLREDELWKLFDQNILKAIDWLRERYGSCTINNWSVGGNFSQSGYRLPSSKWYSKGSQHSIGCGLDLKFSNISAYDVRKDLRKLDSEGFSIPYFTRIEDDVSWLHVDTKVTNLNHIYYFKA